MVISRKLLHTQTSYIVSMYNSIIKRIYTNSSTCNWTQFPRHLQSFIKIHLIFSVIGPIGRKGGCRLRCLLLGPIVRCSIPGKIYCLLRDIIYIIRPIRLDRKVNSVLLIRFGGQVNFVIVSAGSVSLSFKINPSNTNIYQ